MSKKYLFRRRFGYSKRRQRISANEYYWWRTKGIPTIKVYETNENQILDPSSNSNLNSNTKSNYLDRSILNSNSSTNSNYLDNSISNSNSDF